MGWFLALPMARKLIFGAGGLLIIGLLIWWAVSAFNGWKEDLRQEGRDQTQARWDAANDERRRIGDELDVKLAKGISQIISAQAAQLGAIERQSADINVKLPQAIAADPRYQEPACDLTPAVLEEVNRSRRLSHGGRP